MSCRSCGFAKLEEILSLGSLPLANALLDESPPKDCEPTYPLELVFCPNCSLVQITVTVPPEELFREYVYFSSYSDTVVENARTLVSRLVAERGLTRASLAMEVASNDGYLLQHYLRQGVPVLGIEPARNVAAVAVQRGIPTITEFFGLQLAARLRAQSSLANVLHANNVLAHVADLNGFVAGVALVLQESGVAVFEVPYLRNLIDRVEFDTIYHEHLCYFSLSALALLFERHGLMLWDVEQIAIHGGSLRVFATRGGKGGNPSPAVAALIREEKAAGMTAAGYYRAFAARVEEFGTQLRATLTQLKATGARIAAYGASAKSATMLNYLGIGRETIEYVVDRSPAKQGRFTPGQRLPIHPPARLVQDMPDYVLLLAWNFADEVLGQQEEYRSRGGRFVIPLPSLKIV